MSSKRARDLPCRSSRLASTVEIRWTHDLLKSHPFPLTTAAVAQAPAAEDEASFHLEMALWPLATSSTPGPGEVPGQCPGQHCRNDLDQVVFAGECGSGPGLPPGPSRQRGLPPTGLPERWREQRSQQLKYFSPWEARSLPGTPPLTDPPEEQTLQAFISPCLR